MLFKLNDILLHYNRWENKKINNVNVFGILTGTVEQIYRYTFSS